MQSIILRKVAGISGLTPIMRGRVGSFGAAPAPRAVIAFLLSPLVLCILALAAMLAWMLAAGGGYEALGFAGLLPVGSITADLKAAEGQMVERQTKLDAIFKAAGNDLDFNKPEVLKAAGGVANSTAVVEAVNALNDELADLGSKRDVLAKAVKAADDNRRRNITPVNSVPLPDVTDQVKQRELKTLGRVIAESEFFKTLRDTKAGKQNLGAILEGFGLPELKTLFQTSAGWAPESTRTGLVVPAVTRPIQVLDIVPTGNTGMAAVVYMEETTRTHNAAERSEGAAAAESVFALTQRSETVRSIGDSIPVTDEQLDDVQQAESYLTQRLMFAVRQRLDRQIMIGDGNAPNLTGIVTKSGIQTQAKGADPTPDAVYKAMTKVRVTGRAFPNAFVVHPNDWQRVRLLRTADGIYIWGSPSEAGPARIWGIQVVECDALTEGTGVVGDFLNFCQLVERKGIEVAVGSSGTQFVEFERTLRAGMRVAFPIYRAAAFATVTGINVG